MKEDVKVETTLSETPPDERSAHRRSSRTCVGCGAHDDAAEMVHVVAHEGGVVVDALFSRGRGGGLRGGGARGRGAHLHPRPGCLAKAPSGLARALRRPVAVRVEDLGQSLVMACERRMEGLLVSARRLRAVAVGADAAIDAARRGAPLVVVAVDAGTVAEKTEVTETVASGRAIAWLTKADLGRLLGEATVAICAVSHEGIAAELKRMRRCADAGAAAIAEATETREGARCRRPEAR
jgi:predicted RNA-binding protein YlxR (DUF448 family)/acetolactate synthase regulatory subunit